MQLRPSRRGNTTGTKQEPQTKQRPSRDQAGPSRRSKPAMAKPDQAGGATSSDQAERERERANQPKPSRKKQSKRMEQKRQD